MPGSVNAQLILAVIILVHTLPLYRPPPIKSCGVFFLEFWQFLSRATNEWRLAVWTLIVDRTIKLLTAIAIDKGWWLVYKTVLKQTSAYKRIKFDKPTGVDKFEQPVGLPPTCYWTRPPVGRLQDTLAELSSSSGEHMTCKPRKIYHLALNRKTLPTPRSMKWNRIQK